MSQLKVKANDLKTLGLIKGNCVIKGWEHLTFTQSEEIIQMALSFINKNYNELSKKFSEWMETLGSSDTLRYPEDPAVTLVASFIEKNKLELERLQTLKQEMEAIETIIKQLPNFDKGLEHQLDRFIVDNIDTAPASEYRRAATRKVLKLIDIVEAVKELNSL